MGTQNRLPINLSLFAFSDSTSKSPTKILKRFEPNGVVGLGIVAAMNELGQNQDQFVTAKCNRSTVLVGLPRSTPIPISTVSNCSPPAKFGGGEPNLGEEMDLCEEYTCVISQIGNNVVKKREYFNGFKTISTTNCALPLAGSGSEATATAALGREYFLNYCHLCKKGLQGLDIFMYRGEKAFCSAECRCKQISIDERKEKCGSGAMKLSLGYSVSPCSAPMQFFTGVAAA